MALVGLSLLFFITAMIYASVGFGGGSTYLALLVFFQIPYDVLPKIALICNLVVVSGGLYHYGRARLLCLKQIIPFVVGSIPLAYVGGRMVVSETLFLVLVAFSLSMAGLRLLFHPRVVVEESKRPVVSSWILGVPIGAGLGFLSGLVGLGGGIFLAPVMYFLRWGNPKQIAASASFFIFVNSSFGLVGQWMKHSSVMPWEWMASLVIAVWMGGQIGSRWSVGRGKFLQLQRVTAVIILAAAGRIFFGFL